MILRITVQIWQTLQGYLMNLEGIKKLRIETPQGYSGDIIKESRYSFNYQGANREIEVSLGMPLRAESYSAGAPFSIFAMNKPEGYLLDSIRNRFGKIAKLDDMSLLKITGKNQIGRLSYIDSEDDVKSKKQQFSLDELTKSKASEELFNYLADVYFDSGISGFQPKVMVPTANATDRPIEKAMAVTSDLIVKSAGLDYPHLAENEFMCMTVAKLAGINVPECWLSEDGGLFIMKRFDLMEDGGRLGLEDMCSIANKPAEEKYHGSYESISKVISLYCKDNVVESNYRLFQYIAISVLLKNGDAHLKNFSLIYDYPSGKVKLSPLYDVVTTSVYKEVNPRTGMNIRDRTMALNMDKSKEYPSIERLISFGKSICGLSNPMQIIESIEEAKLKAVSINRHRINEEFLKELTIEWGLNI